MVVIFALLVYAVMTGIEVILFTFSRQNFVFSLRRTMNAVSPHIFGGTRTPSVLNSIRKQRTYDFLLYLVPSELSIILTFLEARLLLLPDAQE
jgi:hypothetical protein